MEKILIVVDMQNDFIDGSLGTKEALAILPAVKEKIKKYSGNHDRILYTRDTHHADYLQTQEGKKLPVVHCIKGTNGWEIAKGLLIDGAEVIDKESFGFCGWRDYISGDDIRIELVGLCTDICVVSNAIILKALFPEAEIAVDAGCCAGVTPESHRAALATMEACQVDIIGK